MKYFVLNHATNTNPENIKRRTLIQKYYKVGLQMININKCMQAQKITWIKRILDQNNNASLNDIYIQRLSKFGSSLLFECNFSEKGILKYF